jgi:hypothetical protein
MVTDQFKPGIECDKCECYVEGNYQTDTDFRREYNGRDVCVSCLTDLKLKNNDYGNE